MTGDLRLEGSRGGLGLGGGLVQLAGWLAAACAAVVGAVLAVVFAASLMLISLIGAVLLAFAGLSLSARRTARVRAHARSRPQHLEARRVGHSWVAYSWDQR